MKLPLLILSLVAWVTYQPFIMALINFSRVRRENAGSWCGTPVATASTYVILAAIVFVPFLLATAVTGLVTRHELTRRSRIWISFTCLCGVALLIAWSIVGTYP